MTIEQMQKLLQASLPPKRFKHSLNVYETALKLARLHKVDREKVAIAALLHDCGRQVPTKDLFMQSVVLGIEIDDVEKNQPILLHSKLGVYYAQHKYGVQDPEILQAIALHTTGAADMSKLSMIVYLADLLEPTRDFKGIDELRSLAERDLELTMFKAFATTIRYLLEYALLIHPNCIAGYNQIAAKLKKVGKNNG